MKLKFFALLIICLGCQGILRAQTDSLKFPELNYPEYNGYKGLRNCDLPMAEAIFIPLATQVFHTKDETQKVQLANEILKDNCLSTSQAMKLGSLFSEDNNRLNFLKQAYNHIYDVLNYGQATQILEKDETTNAFLKFVRTQKRQAGGNNNPINNNNPGNPGHNNNPNTPPVVTNTPCLSPISDPEYKLMRRKVRQIYTNDLKESTAKRMFRQHRCLSVTQIKGILRLFHYRNNFV